MNLGTLRADVLDRMRGDSTFFDDVDINKAINEGLEDISEDTNWYEKSIDVKFIHNIMYYDMRTVAADSGDGFLTPTRCFNPQTNRWLIPSDVMDLDLHTYRMWEAVTSAAGSEPQRMIMRGLWWLGLFPKPSYDYNSGNNTGRVTLYYRAIPPLMVADGDSVDFPEEFQLALVYYAMYQLYVEEREVAKALQFWAQYTEVAEAFRRYCDNRIVESAYPGFR